MTEPSKPRRKLFERSYPDHAITGDKIKFLVWLGECGLLSLRQLALLTGKTEGAARRHMFDLFHAPQKFVDRIPIHRSALAPVDAANTADLLGGRASTPYRLTRAGAALLDLELPPDIPDYGPKNSTHIAHELEIRDVRVWLELLRRKYGHEGCTRWETETAAHILPVRSDALFVYQFPTRPLVGLVEVDRNTERSPRRWEEKLQQYHEVFAHGGIFQKTGISTGRVLIIAPHARRRDTIAAVLASKMPYPPTSRLRFWITEKSTLNGVDLLAPVWRVPESEELRPLVGAEIL